MSDSWRLLDLGIVDPYKSVILEEALLIARKEKLTPNTLCFRAPMRHVLVGVNADLKKRINIEYCEKENIPILRDMVGTHAVILDRNIIQYDVDSDTPLNLNQTMEWVSKSLQRIGLDAHPRAKSNDVLVDGKKISGNSVDLIQGIFTASGTIILDFDYEFCENALLPLPELFANKEAQSHREWVTTIKALLGREVSYNEVVSALRKGFEDVFHIEFELSNSLTEAEEQILEKLKAKYQSEQWVKRGKWSPVKDYWGGGNLTDG